MKHEVIISLGSNMDPSENISKAIESINKEFNVLGISPIKRTEPIGYKEQADFLNGAVLIQTDMDSAELNCWLKELETKMGRVRSTNKYGPRTIDLDIIVWNSKIVDDDVYERNFLQEFILFLYPEFPQDLLQKDKN